MDVNLQFLTFLASILALLTGIWNLIISFRKDSRERIDFFRKYESYFTPLSATVDVFNFDDENLPPSNIVILELRLIGAPVQVESGYFIFEIHPLIISNITYASPSLNVETDNSMILYLHLKNEPIVSTRVDFIILFGTHADLHYQSIGIYIGKLNRVDAQASSSFKFDTRARKEFKKLNYFEFGINMPEHI